MRTLFLKESSRGYDALHSEDLLLKERIVFFTEEVTPESSVELIRVLLCLELEDPGKEITICLNSPGGEVISGLSVIDTIRGLKCPVRTVCLGMAASMGALIFLSGDKREMLPNAKVLIHQPRIDGNGGTKTALEYEKTANELMDTRRILSEIIAERTGHTIEEIYEKSKTDYTFNAEEALEYGVATNIVKHI